MAKKYLLELSAWSPRKGTLRREFKGFLSEDDFGGSVEIGFNRALGINIARVRHESSDTCLVFASVSCLDFDKKIDELLPQFKR